MKRCKCGRMFEPIRPEQVSCCRRCGSLARVEQMQNDGRLDKDPSPEEIEERRNWFRRRRDEAHREGRSYVIPTAKEIPWIAKKRS